MEKKVRHVVAWLKDSVKEAQVKGLVVGVSGGLDSAVVAHLIKRAFPDNSLGVIMPCHSSASDLKDAAKVIESCQINSLTIDLGEAHDVLLTNIRQQIEKTSDWDRQREKMSDANMKARLRMTTLYTIANNYNYLVVGTDNASEWFTGYFTKYGDGGVDVNPLVHLTKTEVFEMARYLGVPPAVVDKPPSAGLWDGQTDEEEMGTTYDRIDAYMRGEEIPTRDRLLIEKMHRQTEHKRQIVAFPPKI